MINLNRRFYKFLIFIGILGITACSEERQSYQNLSEVGERPKKPSVIEAKETVVRLSQDKIILLEE